MISTLVSLGAVVMAQSPEAAAASDWRDAASLESPRAGVAATVSDGLIYAAGGSGLLAPIEDFDEYDPVADSWRGHGRGIRPCFFGRVIDPDIVDGIGRGILGVAARHINTAIQRRAPISRWLKTAASFTR